MRIIQRTVSIWRTEEGASLLLAFLLLHLFVVSLLRASFPNLAPASSIAFVLLFVVGVLVVFRSAWSKLGACLIAGAAIALESLLGILYPAVLIGRLVSMNAATSGPPPGDPAA